jgi:DNA polymerase-3 subunit alpha
MLDGLASVNDLFDRALELNQSAIGITDHGTLAAHFDAFKASKRTGVKLIPGCEAYFVHDYDHVVYVGRRKRNERRKHIVLLAKNHAGYKNLLKANYDSFKRQEVVVGRVYPRISWDILESYSDDLICMTACGQGIISEMLMLGDKKGALEAAERLQALFPDRLFLEIQTHHLKVEIVDQELINQGLIELSRKLKLPLVAAVDTHYLLKGMDRFRNMLGAIRFKRPLSDDDLIMDEFYAKSGQEVYDFLSTHYGTKVAGEAVENTVNIANMCNDSEYLGPQGNHLPNFRVNEEKDFDEFLSWREGNVSDHLSDNAAFMRFRCFKGFGEKFGHMEADELKTRWDRVKYEVEILERNNFSGYMLVVSDYIKWAKDNGIIVGVGRGSVGGCLIAYLLDIHGVDPFDYGLMFERFQNAGKTDLPDIDTDFTAAGRDSVEEYVRKKYGHEYCAQVSNFNTYTPKNVIPDLARSMRLGGEDHFQLAGKIKDVIPDKDPDGKKVSTLKQALELSSKFAKYAEEYPDLIEYAKVFVGLEKEYGTHAAGMVVSDIPIMEFAPVRIDKNGSVASQHDKNRCEELGLVKMDFLSLMTLDIIGETLNNIKLLGDIGPDKMEDIPLDDVETYEMLSQGLSKCVFQLGKTNTMASLCKNIKPKNIIDIAIINALGRPSSNPQKLADGSVYCERDEFIARRNGAKSVSYLHPSLKCLEESYGLCIMEEQLMGVAQSVAGWDLNKADGLRKLTKLKEKGKDLAVKLEKDFIQGAVDTRGMPSGQAKEIWDKVVSGFSGYGFNKSHAVFYSINSYYTAYLKRHHPAAFLAAKLKIETASNSITSDGEVESAKQECRRLGIKIIPPDINRSSAGHEVLDGENIVTGLSAVKGMGEKAVLNIELCQPFSSFADFLHRVNARVVNKSRVEALAKAGCFDSFKITRKFAYDEGKATRERLRRVTARAEKDGYDVNETVDEFPLKAHDGEWDRKTLLANEMEVLGRCLSGSLNELYSDFFTGFNVTPISHLNRLPNRYSILTELLVKSAIREFTIKKTGKNFGRKMIKYSVEDIEGDMTELTVWPDQYGFAKKFLNDGTPIRAYCQVSDFNGQKTLVLVRFQSVYGIDRKIN